MGGQQTHACAESVSSWYGSAGIRARCIRGAAPKRREAFPETAVPQPSRPTCPWPVGKKLPRSSRGTWSNRAEFRSLCVDGGAPKSCWAFREPGLVDNEVTHRAFLLRIFYSSAGIPEQLQSVASSGRSKAFLVLCSWPVGDKLPQSSWCTWYSGAVVRTLCVTTGAPKSCQALPGQAVLG